MTRWWREASWPTFLVQAVALGAASLVVLDAGDVCHLDVAPRPFPEGLVVALSVATRQRVLLEAPLIAQHLPVVYLPRPCSRNRSPLDLDSSHELIDPSRRMSETFLSATPPPAATGMVGAPTITTESPGRHPPSTF